MAAPGERDPYQVLVSELMLQQTQVSRVVERFRVFVARFPTFAALAAADEGEVMALWAGLGYYRRARLLHAAAKAVVGRHGGEMPREMAAIGDLPGVGRYTAGAIASIGLGRAEALVDGNVSRVLLRLEGKALASDDPAAVAFAWERAGELVRAAANPGAFNEALMELGATVCTPTAPKCGECPWREACVARREGTMGEIPRPKTRVARTSLRFECVVLRDAKGRVLLEQRPVGGLWGGLWQPPSVEMVGTRKPAAGELLAKLGLPEVALAQAGVVRRTLTHRNVVMRVWVGAAGGKMEGRAWFEVGALPAMSSAHVAVLARAEAEVGD
jgi:A/G-specific adenine glycosylase